MENDFSINSKVLVEDISILKKKILTIDDVYNFSLENSKFNLNLS